MRQDFSQLDSFFAHRLDPSCESFLIRLMASARAGHLCQKIGPRTVLNQSLVAIGDTKLPEKPLVYDQGRIYIQRNWVLETILVEELTRLMQTKPSLLFKEQLISPQRSLTSEQREVLRSVLNHSLTLVSGGPGTGKSFTAMQTLRSLLEGLQKEKLFVKIAAPTGKAADRLARSLPSDARLDVEVLTLHRMLRLQPGQNRLFDQRMIEADLIFVDEASMIDASLFAHLLSAIPSQSRLLLLGDADQLPPVHGGGIFGELSELMGIRLTFCHRTQKESLHHLFQAVREKNATPLLKALEPFPQDLYGWIEEIFACKTPEEFAQTRVISPLRKGPFGVDALNNAMIRRLEKRLAIGETWYAPILMTRNDPSLEIFNGTEGLVKGLYLGEGLLTGSETVYWPDGKTTTLRELSGFEFAFALSAHKSQGSEFQRVFCLLPPQSEESFGQQALYTALTRAQSEVRIYGNPETIRKMIQATTTLENGIRERLKVPLR